MSSTEAGCGVSGLTSTSRLLALYNLKSVLSQRSLIAPQLPPTPVNSNLLNAVSSRSKSFVIDKDVAPGTFNIQNKKLFDLIKLFNDD